MRTNLLLVVLVAWSAHAALADAEECTIGVAGPGATPDGRPLIWKSRDTGTVNNEVIFNDTRALRFIAVVNADGSAASEAWMGINERGFAILNANCPDVGDDGIELSNGTFMRDALGCCASVAEFVALLDTTNGARDTRANFAVLDSAGAAMMFEASPDTYWTFDTRDVTSGWIVRTNFACHDTIGDDLTSRTGIERFHRSRILVADLAAAGQLAPAGLFSHQMRDFATREGVPLTVPCAACGDPDSLYGFIDARWSICRDITVSSAVIQGVDPAAVPKEPAFLSTMWVQLGNPAVTVASPYWPVGPTPPAADGPGTAPLCDRAREMQAWVCHSAENSRLFDSFRLSDATGGGIWAQTLPAEAAILACGQARLDAWRADPPGYPALLAFEDSLASAALLAMSTVTTTPPPGDAVPIARLGISHPNPFNGGAVIPFTLSHAGAIELAVFDARGRRVVVLAEGWWPAGDHAVTWTADTRPAGIYLVRLAAGGQTATRKCSLVK